MKAEELFEKLGYKKQVGFESICFVYENEDTADFEIIFDLLNTYRLCKEECKFRDCTQLRQLKEKGYYKDVDTDAKIRDILWNCGVIQNGKC